jgi:hypothetical protein
MSELIERYLHQVGSYLPTAEQADIEAELRALIQDQIADRFGGAPTPDQITTILAELGDPHQMAISYQPAQYLVGPRFYPVMMRVLRRVWFITPAVSLFLSLFGTLLRPGQQPLPTMLAEFLVGTAQAIFTLSAVVVLFFAISDKFGPEQDENAPPFNPLNLPKINDPRLIDRFEILFGSVFGVFIALLLFYFLLAGGLTLRFDLSNPAGDPASVIPVPAHWLAASVAITVIMLFLHLFVLRRNRWNVQLWACKTLFQAFASVCLYFILYKPLIPVLLERVPALAGLPFADNLPIILVFLTAVPNLWDDGSKLLTIWRYTTAAKPAS